MPAQPAYSLWRRLGTPVLVPNLLYGTGEGAIIPIVPLVAHQLHASLAAAALVSAMLPVAQWLANLPSGWVVGRIGERRSMYAGAYIACIGAVICWASVNIVMLSVGTFLVGAAAAVFALARHSYVTVAVPLSHRGRGVSLLAGANRLGMLVGPLLGAAAITVVGDARTAFGVTVIASVLIVANLRFLAGPEDLEAAMQDRVATDAGTRGVWATLWMRREVLLKVGLAAGLIGVARISRQLIVPLIGVVMGLQAAEISIIVGICAALDFALFYLGGQIMDRFGRLWTAVPCMLGFAASLAALAVAPELPHAFAWYFGAALVMSICNGLTSGIVNAMGSDLADQRAPATFLSTWRVVTECGQASAPFVISTITGLASLATATLTMAGVALFGALLLLRYVPRYLPKQPGRTTAEGNRVPDS